MPQFIQREWTQDRHRAVGRPKSVDVVFRKATGAFFIECLPTKVNFAGRDLWSLSQYVPERRFIETGPFKTIDNSSSVVLKKMKREESLSESDRIDLAYFVSSLYYRQPENVKVIREMGETALRSFDDDGELTYLLAQQGLSKKPRDFAFLDGLYYSDYVMQGWLNNIRYHDLLNDILDSTFALLPVRPKYALPLSDRPLVTVTLPNHVKLRMIAISPHLLLTMHKPLDRKFDQSPLNIAKAASLYVQHCIENAVRGVVVKSTSDAWRMLPLFRPKDLWGRDYGPRTDNPDGLYYSFCAVNTA